MKQFQNLFEAWKFLNENNIFEELFCKCLDIDVIKVNPRRRKSKHIGIKGIKDEMVVVQVECGPWVKKKDLGKTGKYFPHGVASHDIRLDCEAETFEKAIIKLANLVLKYYGTNKNVRKEQE